MLASILKYIARRVVEDEWRVISARILYEERKCSFFSPPSPAIIAQCLLVSGEDHRHGMHNGYDLRAICRAIWRWTTGYSKEGASTIEQQIVRVISGRVERTIWRKIREILLSVLVADNFSKKYLPAIYLRIGYYGWRMNNYQDACRRLQISPKNISFQDAAELVARLKYPQPQRESNKRRQQILIRGKHLMALYNKHHKGGFYDFLLA